MSMEVIKPGMVDVIQDEGRFGYQHMGINPGGAMDLVAMRVANAIVGNDKNEAVLEMTFPAASLRFKEPAVIALAGADFSATLNTKKIKLHAAVFIPAGSELTFTKKITGAFCYLAIKGGLALNAWLGSNSTHVKAKAGAQGRALQKGDVIQFRETNTYTETAVKISRWSVNVSAFYPHTPVVRILNGPEVEYLQQGAKKKLYSSAFTLTAQSDRMGYRLKGPVLKQKNNQQLISTVATWGTVQLLPGGQLIILLADHQTTGGYPRVAHFISANRSALAQRQPGQPLVFQPVDLATAEDLLVAQHNLLKQIELSCQLHVAAFLKELR
jgi:antagonist of KipI